ncbi:Uncharacterised protein [Bordetella pertussis]|nr:Uncharacterised protein [Bordetella pertussis]
MKRLSSSGSTISTFWPGTMRRPNFLMRISITDGRPTRMGSASFSSITVCTARSTRSSSPSAYTTRLGACLACWNSGRINWPE